ncbi:MAG: FkbM family methyltransferase [Cyclobacteriaceae bacterium]
MKKVLKKLIVGGTQSGIYKIKYGLAADLLMNVDPSSKTQRILGLDEREIMPVFERFSKDSAIFIDVGASDGYYGLIHKRINPKGKVHLFDGGEVFLGEQKQNFQLNSLVIDEQKAVLVGASSTSNMITIDDHFSDSVECFFLKIDVEGAEMEVLQGAERIISHNNCKIIIETHSSDLEKKCREFLEALGYRIEIIKNAWWRTFVPEARSLPHNRWLSAEK